MPFYTFSESLSGSEDFLANGETPVNQDNPVEPIKKYIYVIRNKINDKVYVGQTKNPSDRWKDHLQSCNDLTDNSVIHKAMNKYGHQNFYMEILEGPIENYNEREKFWISFFNSISPNGYNILPGGQEPPVRKGFANNKSKINKEQLYEIYELLKNPHLTLAEIGSYYNYAPSTIRAINQGRRYKQKDIQYPIRDFQVSGEAGNMLSEEQVKFITNELIKSIETKESLRKISIRINININKIYAVNEGKVLAYRLENIDYPIRKDLSVSLNTIQKIKNELMQGILSKQQIASKYKVSYAIVAGINNGQHYTDENLIYPLKKHEGRYDFPPELFEEIRKAIKSGMSFDKIASKFHLPNKGMVHDINSGKSHRSENYTYPIVTLEREFKYDNELVKKIENELVNTKKSLQLIADENNVSRGFVTSIKNGKHKYKKNYTNYPLRKTGHKTKKNKQAQ